MEKIAKLKENSFPSFQNDGKEFSVVVDPKKKASLESFIRKLHSLAIFRVVAAPIDRIYREQEDALFLPTCASYISTLRTVQCSVIYEEIYSKRINPFQKKK